MKKRIIWAYLGISFFLHATFILGLVLVTPQSPIRSGAVMEVSLVSLAGPQGDARATRPASFPAPENAVPAKGYTPVQPAAEDQVPGDGSQVQGRGEQDGPELSQADSGMGDKPKSGGISLDTYHKLIEDIIFRNRSYPTSARYRHIEGSVDVQFTIDGTGRASDIRVVKTSGSGALDRTSVQTIQRCSFPPPPAKSITLTKTIVFRLVDGSQS